MSNLTPSSITLDKGLDLQSPKVVAPPGSILDMLNYEQVDFIGQKRIDGYTRYDGSPLSAIDDFYLVDGATTTDYTTYVVAFHNDMPYGVVVGEIDGRDAIAVIDHNFLPTGVWGVNSGLTSSEHYDYVLQFNAYLRERVEGLPGPVIGLHWFRDRLYAVADFATYSPDDDRIDTANKATLWESRTVQQVLEEDSGPYDFGWKMVHQGWWVEFEHGASLFGSLVSKNQNRQGVGVQGPTGTSGNSGSPLRLFQNVRITNEAAQVNGWKRGDTPSTYTLRADDVALIDSDYVYADAFIEWSRDVVAGVSTIAAPGADGINLVEQPATATVEVRI